MNDLFDESKETLVFDVDIEDAVNEIATYPMPYKKNITFRLNDIVIELSAYQERKDPLILMKGKQMIELFIL